MKRRGFTYIEMMVVLAIMAILLLLAMPSAKYRIQHQKEQDLKVALNQIRTAIDAYKKAADSGHVLVLPGESGYPKSLDDLVQGVTDQLTSDHRKMYFLRSLPRDPFAKDDQTPAASTWAPRSYSSPPDNPAPGDDVYDIHSLSKEKSLNGVPYNLW